MLQLLKAHLGSPHVSRIVYGVIIGLAVIVALDQHPPSSGVVIATLLGTAVAVGLAEVYSDIVGTETRTRRHIRRADLPDMAYDGIAVGFGISFPAVFFVLAAAGVMEKDTAFTVAAWSGLGLISFYGFCAARLAGESPVFSVLQALGVGLIGAILIALKAVLH